MTIHGRHDLKASDLNDLTTCSLIENLLQKQNTKIKFYFVVPSNVFSLYKTKVSISGDFKQKDRMQQYVAQIDF